MRNLLALFILLSGLNAQAAAPANKPKKPAKVVAPVTRVPAQASADDEEDDASGPTQTEEEKQQAELPPAPQSAPVRSDSTPPDNEYQEPMTVDANGSEKVYDWNKYGGEKQIDHPLAEKGLIRITKDRTYIYKTDETDQRRAASFHVGMLSPENLENPEESGKAGSTFEENYDSATGPMLMLDYEWQLWHTDIGKFGVRVGSGIFVAQGHGHFVNNNQTLEPRETFTFLALPNSLGAVYRAQLWHKQLFVPYGEGGLIGWTFTEFRDDDKGPKFGAAPAAYAAGGVGFNLTYFDAFSRIQLDREYGINAVYLTVEYRTVIALSDKYDFSSDVINGGFLMEF